MLHNPKWDVEVKADPFSLDSLITWLEKQPADKAYDFFDNCGCLLHQYLSDHGFTDVHIGGTFARWSTGSCNLSASFRNVARGDVRDGDRWNFGAALARAREALSR